MNVKITFTTWNVVVWEFIFFEGSDGVFYRRIRSRIHRPWSRALDTDIRDSRTTTVDFQSNVRYSTKPTFAYKNTLFIKFKVIGKIWILYFLEFSSIFFLLFGIRDKNVPILVSGAFRFNSIFHSIIGWAEYYCVISARWNYNFGTVF